MAVELVLLGTLGAAASLGAGLIKTFVHRKPVESKTASAHGVAGSSTIMVTVHTGTETIEKQGVIPSDKISEVFDMVDDGKTSPQPTVR
jgi:hypothetical protein